MKVAYVIYPDALVSGRSNGVRSQALVWKDILESKGICVDLINCWEHYNWRDYDVVHYLLIVGGIILLLNVRMS